MNIPKQHSWIAFLVFAVVFPSAMADEAAEHYLLACVACGSKLPNYVENASTDHQTFGFAIPISAEHASFLDQPDVQHALSHFEEATTRTHCKWERYTRFSWSEGDLNVRLHQLARLALFRARTHYDSERWIDGNRDVERVRIMARHMTQQARPHERQCFMVENMAIFTAGAYLLRFPKPALADLLKRHHSVGDFSPMRGILSRESSRIRDLANEVSHTAISPPVALSLSGYAIDENVETEISDSILSCELQEMSVFLDQASQHIETRIPDEAEKQLNTLTRLFDDNHLVRVPDEYASDQWRENAQSVCRNIMFSSVIEQLSSDNPAFAMIPDPYGTDSLQVKVNGPEVVLVSVLTHFSRINFRFGAAGKQ